MHIVYIAEHGNFAWSADVDAYIMYHDKHHHAVLLIGHSHDITSKVARVYRDTSKILRDVHRSWYVQGYIHHQV